MAIDQGSRAWPDSLRLLQSRFVFENIDICSLNITHSIAIQFSPRDVSFYKDETSSVGSNDFTGIMPSGSG